MPELREDGYVREISKAIAADLSERGIIYRCGEEGETEQERAERGSCSTDDLAIYHLDIEYEHLTSDDLDALCAGVEIADEILNPELES